MYTTKIVTVTDDVTQGNARNI